MPMADVPSSFGTPEALSPLICRSESDPRPVVVMTCGIAGSGKSFISKWIQTNHPSFHRLSIDSYIYGHHGLYGVDYPKEKYNDYQEEAAAALRSELAQLVQQGSRDAILDFAFAFQETRDEWKDLIEESGGRWVLVYLDVDADELRRRVKARNQLAVKDGDSAFLVTEETLESFIAGFERPVGEGEVVLRLND
ncbi:ATP/GTP-binding protein [Penicillium brasilianum]|uniref:ATP/GTP-binding protein n=1 Tax=Penicillium brasilianum TaxID=104259 RepID=A0A1S9RCW3_PENBI|nr:ATP/GTP-binding protein [Penicillium brasilianum]